MDHIEKVELAEVIKICRKSRSLSEAGRILYSASRQRRTNINDANRLKKLLSRYGLFWENLK